MSLTFAPICYPNNTLPMSYKDLKSYQSAVIIYDFTVAFCNRYLTNRTNNSNWPNANKSYRTYDQMVQAARSGKQNIVEGSSEKASRKAEIKLLGVARASFQELLEDYEDFLRQNGFKLWEKESAEAKQVRGLVYQPDWSYQSYRSYLADPEKAANVMICLINQTNYLLDQQLKKLKEKFLNEGGWTEQMFRERLRRRNQPDQPDLSNRSNQSD